VREEGGEVGVKALLFSRRMEIYLDWAGTTSTKSEECKERATS
jgi:hypothetical protein